MPTQSARADERDTQSEQRQHVEQQPLGQSGRLGNLRPLLGQRLPQSLLHLIERHQRIAQRMPRKEPAVQVGSVDGFDHIPFIRPDACLVAVAREVDRDELLVDIGSKAEGVVPAREMQSLTSEDRAELKPGDELLVFVVQTEDREGRAVLSVDKARQEKSWRRLQISHEGGEVIEAKVVNYNKGGLLVNLDLRLHDDPSAFCHPPQMMAMHVQPAVS